MPLPRHVRTDSIQPHRRPLPQTSRTAYTRPRLHNGRRIRVGVTHHSHSGHRTPNPKEAQRTPSCHRALSTTWPSPPFRFHPDRSRKLSHSIPDLAPQAQHTPLHVLCPGLVPAIATPPPTPAHHAEHHYCGRPPHSAPNLTPAFATRLLAYTARPRPPATPPPIVFLRLPPLPAPPPPWQTLIWFFRRRVVMPARSPETHPPPPRATPPHPPPTSRHPIAPLFVPSSQYACLLTPPQFPYSPQTQPPIPCTRRTEPPLLLHSWPPAASTPRPCLSIPTHTSHRSTAATHTNPIEPLYTPLEHPDQEPRTPLLAPTTHQPPPPTWRPHHTQIF
jgi:hypothetical protein